jgi:hypothetical protein
LITILIISILAAMILGVAALAGETAREQHTRHVVTRLHNLLMERYNTYKTRRVRLNPAVEQQINARNWQSIAQRGQALAEARLYALREMILLEIPDRWSDVLLERPESFNPGPPPLQPLYLNERTDLSYVYLRRYRNLLGRTNALSGSLNTFEEIKRNQGAECLYLVITLSAGDGEARSQFGETSIGDTDGDGALEFLDGWGHPIEFFRWAPGFNSLVQLNQRVLDTMDADDANLEIGKDHDPFDIFRRENGPLPSRTNAFRLVPLIYAAGRDEELGLDSMPDFVTWRVSSSSTLTFNSQPPLVGPQLTPYKKGGAIWPPQYFGTELGDGSDVDNVHNHLLGLR